MEKHGRIYSKELIDENKEERKYSWDTKIDGTVVARKRKEDLLEDGGKENLNIAEK